MDYWAASPECRDDQNACLRRSLHRARARAWRARIWRARRPDDGRAAGPYEDALSRFSADSFDQTIEGINEVVASGNRARRACHHRPAGGAASVQRGKQACFHSRAARPADRRCDRPTGRRRPPGRPRAGAAQQPVAADRRSGARWPDADGAGSGQTPGSGAGGAQVQGCERASSARPGHCQGNRRQGETGLDRGASRGRALPRQRIRCRQDRCHRPDPRAWRPGGAVAARRIAGERVCAGQEGGGRCHRLDPEQSGDLDRGAEHLVRPLARFGPAARRDRARHHLRRDGRDQHGAWRDGHARRLYHLRGAGGDPRPQPRAVRLFARLRHPARLSVRRIRRHPDRARRHPLSLRPAAGDAAGHLGAVADHPAGGAHRLWSDQQGRRQPVLDERIVRSRPHHHHLQPPLDHRVHAADLRRPARACCATRASAWRCARSRRTARWRRRWASRPAASTR